jgi:tRNA-specific 2-thiouridylase
MKRIAVGLSGGVDSSVAAAILKKQGHEVIGITMRIYDESFGIREGAKHACFGPGEKEDIEVSQRVADALGIAYRVVDLRAEYKERVLDYFRDEYLAGRTPNPCVRCNTLLKFGFLVDRAREAGLDFDVFATGHYARIGTRRGRACLMKGADPAKDQSYFIYRLEPERLESIAFPLGEFTKPQVRAMAREFGLETAEMAESQDFIAGGDYSPIFRGSGLEQGDIVDDSGKLLGRHKGIAYYTIGQRRGVGVAAGEPLYVSGIDAKRNRIVVSVEEKLFSKALLAREVFLQDPQERGFDAWARIRQNHRPAEARAEIQVGGQMRVGFASPQRGVAPGQSVVLYEGDFVIGGGTIDQTEPAEAPEPAKA